jgi:hypothetical protein
MTFIIFPYQGVNDLKFGMKRQEIRQIIGVNNSHTEFRRSSTSENTIDAYDSLGVFVNYDKNDNCKCFEFFNPAKVFLGSHDLFSLSFNNLIEIIRLQDKDIEENESGFSSFELGIGIYTPDRLDEPDRAVEGIIVFKKGYYG